MGIAWIRPRSRRVLLALGILAATVLVAACGGTPGGGPEEAQTSPDETGEAVQTSGFEDLGPVTLTMRMSASVKPTEDAWNEVAQAFQEKYPNVTVDITFISFDELVKETKLLLSGSNPPDIPAGNQGYGLDGPLVEAGLILPLDKYAEAYGWDDRFTSSWLEHFRWTPDGKTFGTGNLYGVAPTVQYVGVFYNKRKLAALGLEVPQTFDEFEAALAAAKAAGETPISLGNSEQWPAVHLWASIQTALVPAEEVRGWIFGENPLSATGNVESLSILRDWIKKGYVTPGYDGLSYDDQLAHFASGDAVFLVTGTWATGAVLDGLKDQAGFFLFPPREPGRYANSASGSLPLHISAKSDHPDLAAAFIDFAVSEETAPIWQTVAAEVTVVPIDAPPGVNPLQQEITQQWSVLDEAGGTALYSDWPTVNMGEVMFPALQEMMAGRITSEEFLSRINNNWQEFHDSRAP